MRLHYRKNKIMIIKIEENLFEVETSESYNNTIYYVNDNILLPYINIMVFTSNYSGLENNDRLDYSYLIFKGVKEINFNCTNKEKFKERNIILSNLKYSDYLIEHVMGKNVFDNGCEFKILYKDAYLYISDRYRKKRKPLDFWTPIETPRFLNNMNKDEVNNFFSKENIPNQILNFLQISSPSEFHDIFSLFN